jgi:hypothetical protein
MNSIFNGLLEFPELNQLEDYLNNLSTEDSIKLLELSIHYGQKNGWYSLTESHCLFICLKKLKENKNE